MDVVIQICTVLAGIFAFLVAVLALFTHHRDAAILCAWLGTLCLVTLGFAWFQDREWKRDAVSNDRFSVTFATGVPLEGPAFMDSHYWIALNDVVSPICLLAYIRFTNLDSAPLMIDSYRVEMSMNDGRWIKLTTIKAMEGQIFVFGPNELADAHRLKMEENGFDYRVIDKNIGPRDTVVGWIFLDVPTDMLFEGKPQFRFFMKPIGEDKEYMASVNFLKRNTESLQHTYFRIGETKDISKYPRKFYHEVYQTR